MPDFADAIACRLAGLCVLDVRVKRLALIGPLLHAVVPRHQVQSPIDIASPPGINGGQFLAQFPLQFDLPSASLSYV